MNRFFVTISLIFFVATNAATPSFNANGDGATVAQNIYGGVHNTFINHTNNNSDSLKTILREFVNNNELVFQREDLATLNGLVPRIDGRINYLHETRQNPNYNISHLHIIWSADRIQEDEKQHLRDILNSLNAVTSIKTLRFEINWGTDDQCRFKNLNLVAVEENPPQSIIVWCLGQLRDLNLSTLDFTGIRLENSDIEEMINTISYNIRNKIQFLKVGKVGIDHYLHLSQVSQEFLVFRQ